MLKNFCGDSNKTPDFLQNYEIKRLCTIHTGGKANRIFLPKNEDELVCLLGLYPNVYVLGNMSNVLPCDEIKSTLLTTRLMKKISVYGNCVSADAGVSLSSLIVKTSNLGLCGLQNLYGIPASVGGAVSMNCGAFNCQISDCVKSVKCFDKNKNKVCFLSRGDCDFSYRKSVFLYENLTVLSVTFEFDFCDENKAIKEAFEAKKKKDFCQPTDKFTFGSVFKRKDGIVPAKLIDSVGLKGYQIGGAVISRKHAGFIENNGTATAEDILNLIDTVKERIYKAFGVMLECEVKIIS